MRNEGDQVHKKAAAAAFAQGDRHHINLGRQQKDKRAARICGPHILAFLKLNRSMGKWWKSLMCSETWMSVASASGRKNGKCSESSSPSTCSTNPSYAPARPLPALGLEKSPFWTTQPYGPQRRGSLNRYNSRTCGSEWTGVPPLWLPQFCCPSKGKLLRVVILTFHLRGGQMRSRGDHDPSKELCLR